MAGVESSIERNQDGTFVPGADHSGSDPGYRDRIHYLVKITCAFSESADVRRDLGHTRRVADTRNRTLVNDTYDCLITDNKHTCDDVIIILLHMIVRIKNCFRNV